MAEPVLYNGGGGGSWDEDDSAGGGSTQSPGRSKPKRNNTNIEGPKIGIYGYDGTLNEKVKERLKEILSPEEIEKLEIISRIEPNELSSLLILEEKMSMGALKVTKARTTPDAFVASLVGGFVIVKAVGVEAIITTASSAYATLDKGFEKAYYWMGGKTATLRNVVSDRFSSLFNKGTGKSSSNFANQTREQLLKSKVSYKKLIQEHKTKLKDYIKNPDAYDNKGILKNVTPEIRQKIIEGRKNALTKQILKQQRELEKIMELLKRSD